MDVELVDPRDVTMEQHVPNYRVHFSKAVQPAVPIERNLLGLEVREFLVRNARDFAEVLTWARETRYSAEEFTIFAEWRLENDIGLLRLFGSELEAPRPGGLIAD